MDIAIKDIPCQPEPSQSHSKEQFDVKPCLADALKKVRQPLTIDDMEVSLSAKRYRGAEAIDEDLKCGLCRKVVWEPKQCGNCTTLHCTSCIEAVLTGEERKCPDCKQEYKASILSKFAVKSLNNLKFACEVCDLEYAYSDARSHKFVHFKDYVACPLGCGQSKILRSEIEDHFRRVCTAIRTNCTRCGAVVTRGQQSDHDCTRENASKIAEVTD